jgi:hypothetical protein
VANPIAEAFVEILPDSSKFTKELEEQVGPAIKDAEKQASSLSGKVSNSFDEAGVSADRLASRAAVVSTVAIGAIGAVGGMAIKQASDLSESINAVNVTFGAASEGIRKLGEDAATSVGLSNAEFNGLAVRFSGFVKQVAGDGGDVIGTMDDLTTRAADFASVMNLDVNDAAQIFQSSLAGESESIRRFGIDMSAAAVEAQALEMGLGTVTKTGLSLTESEKVMARYELLMSSTASTAGDFANTSDGLANSQRIASAQIKDAGAKIGNALMPALAKATNLLASFAGWASQNTGLILGLGIAIGTIATAVLAVSTAYKVYQAYQKFMLLYTAFQERANWRLNASFLANPVVLIVAGVIALIAALVLAYQKVEWFRNAVDAVFSAIKTAIGAVVDFFVAAWDVAFAVVRGGIEFVVSVFTRWFDFLAGVVRMYVDAWSRIFRTLWDGIKAGFGAVRDVVVRVFDGISGAFKAVINGILGALEWGVNMAIKPINKLIDGVNLLPFVDIPNVPEIKLPRLANGGIIGGPTIAMVGEAGAEAVIPLTRPGRAMSLMEQTGLADLARGSSAAVRIDNATFVAPVDADLVAQKVLVAERLRSFGS